MRFETLEDRQLLHGSPELVLDLPATARPGSSMPREIVEVNGDAYFVAYTLSTGFELWKRDGASGDVALVKDLLPGDDYLWEVNRQDPHYLANVNGTLYFMASSPSDYGLFKTDGTAAGTVLLKSYVNRGGMSSIARNLTNIDGTLYFAADDGVHGLELWKSDGTAAGTTLVKDVNPGVSGSSPAALTEFDGVAYFTANDGSSGTELWRSDGTPAGTFMLRDAVSGAMSSSPADLTVVNNALFFVTQVNSSASALWRTDGTTSGTMVLKQIPQVKGLEALGDVLIVGSSKSQSIAAIWTSDGTESGTIEIGAEIASPASVFGDLTTAGELVYFQANLRLWRTDGTLGGTYALDVQLSGSRGGYQSILFPFGSNLIARTDVGLYVTNETIGGSEFLGSPFRPAPPQGAFETPGFAVVGDEVLFQAGAGVADVELWRTDGTRSGTRQAVNLSETTVDLVSDVLEMNGSAYFKRGNSLWRVEDVGAATEVFNFGAWTEVDFTKMVVADGALLLAVDKAPSSGGGSELWRSDGTSAGTVRIASFADYLLRLTAAEGFVVFDTGNKLWRSDGTERGTFELEAVLQKPYLYPNYQRRVLGDTVYFMALVGVEQVLWQSDGSIAGTIPVRTALGMPPTWTPKFPIQAEGVLYFAADDGVHGVELWRSAGTPGTTTLVKDINPGAASAIVGSTLSALTGFEFDGAFYFSANDGVHGEELWRSDGTAGGTQLVKDINAGTPSSKPQAFTRLGDELLFWSTDVTTGRELWRTDGTTVGTSLVVDTNSSRTDWNLSLHANGVLDGKLYYLGLDDDHGFELWSTSGDAASTSMVFDFAVGDSLPSSIVAVGRSLFFTARTESRGRDLWVIRPEADGGDYDGNGIVDGGDFLAWQRQFGAPATPAGSGADGDRDGVVGAGDLQLWRSNFGLKAPSPTNSSAANPAAAPPATLPSVQIESGTTAVVAPKDAQSTEPLAAIDAIDERGNSAHQASWWADLHGRHIDAAPQTLQQVADDQRPLWFKRNHAAATAAKRVALLDSAFMLPARQVSTAKPSAKAGVGVSPVDLDDRFSTALALEETEFWRE